MRKGPGGCRFGFGRNQPHQHLLLGGGVCRAGQGGTHPAGVLALEPGREQWLWSSAWSVPACAGSEQAQDAAARPALLRGGRVTQTLKGDPRQHRAAFLHQHLAWLPARAAGWKGAVPLQSGGCRLWDCTALLWGPGMCFGCCWLLELGRPSQAAGSTLLSPITSAGTEPSAFPEPLLSLSPSQVLPGAVALPSACRCPQTKAVTILGSQVALATWHLRGGALG